MDEDIIPQEVTYAEFINEPVILQLKSGATLPAHLVQVGLSFIKVLTVDKYLILFNFDSIHAIVLEKQIEKKDFN